MKANHKRRLGIGAAVFAVLMLVTISDVSAWPVNRHHPGRSSGRTLQSWWMAGGFAPGPQTIQSFSYEPATITAGDRVIVAADGTGIMSGRTTLGVAEKGDRFVVTQVIGTWLGAKIEVDGRTISGWVRRDLVEPDKDMTVAKTADRPPQTQVAIECRPYRTNRRYRR